MSSSGPQSTSSTQLPDWLTQFGQGLAGSAAQAAQMPYQPYTQQRVADLSPLQTGALGAYGQAGQALLPLLSQTGSALSGAISGNQDPYQQQVINATNQNVTDAYNNAVSQTTGRFNSPGNLDSARSQMSNELNQRALATGLANGDASVFSNDYNNSANRSLSAVGQLGSLANTGANVLNSALAAGGVPQQQQQQLLNSLYSDFTEQRNYPWSQLQNAAGLLTGARGAAGSTTTTQQGYDPVSQGLGIAMLGNSLNGSGKGGSGASVG